MSARTIQVAITFVIDGVESTVDYDTADQKIEIHGDLYPADLSLANGIVSLVKQRDREIRKASGSPEGSS